MTRSRKFWLGLVITLIGIVAAQPLLRLQLVFQLDTIYHMQRAAQVETALRSGFFYQRFSPDLAYGFGYPILNYYAPLLYYFIAPWLLAGVPIIAATAIVCSLIFILGAWGMYFLASAHMSDIGAVVASASFVLAPYVLSNTMTRGALAEHLGLALAPWALHSVYRVARSTNPGRAIALGALPMTALIISHNLSAFLVAILMVFYALFVVGSATSRPGLRLISITLCAVLGLLLAAFFWLPVLLERNLVQLNLIYEPLWSDVRTNFQSVESQFRLPIVWDHLRQFDEDPSRISLLSQGLALLALAHVLRWRRNRPRAVLVAGCAVFAGVLLFMVFPASAQAWDVLTPLRVLQFPWRLLGPNALLVALLVGFAYEFLREIMPARVCVGLATLLLIATVFYIFPRQIISFPVDKTFSIDPQYTADSERTSGTLGTTVAGEFIPKAVWVRPSYTQSVFAAGNDRVWRESLPASAKLSQEKFDPLRYGLHTQSAEPFALTFRTFFFEGWRAGIDGQDVLPFSIQPNGLLSVAVPAGEHDVQVWFGSTPVRDIANGLSLFGVLAWVGLMGFSLRRRANEPSLALISSSFTPFASYLFVGVLLALLALKTVWVDAGDTPFARSRFNGTSIVDATHPAQVNFNNELVLMGADMISAAPVVPAGGKLKFKAFLRAPQKPPRNLTVGFQLVSDQGDLVGQENHEAPAGLQFLSFEVGKYSRDDYALQVLPATPPGSYRLLAHVFPYRQPDQRLSIIQDGSIRGVTYELARVTVERPAQPATPKLLAISHAISATLVPGLVLAGYDLPNTQAASGDRLPLVLYWQAGAPLAPNQTFQMLVDDVPLAAQPLVIGFDTQHWQPGDVWRGNHTVWLPPSLAAGEHTLALRIASGPPVTLGQIKMSVPKREMTQPATTKVITQSRLAFGNVAQLVGFDLPVTATPAQPLTLRLVWRALGEGETSYKVFVHLLAADGALVASNDAIPAAWTRPTNTWLRNEFIADDHAITLPANLPNGTYTVSAGLYNDLNGERLTLSDGNTRATLGVVQIP